MSKDIVNGNDTADVNEPVNNAESVDGAEILNNTDEHNDNIAESAETEINIDDIKGSEEGKTIGTEEIAPIVSEKNNERDVEPAGDASLENDSTDDNVSPDMVSEGDVASDTNIIEETEPYNATDDSGEAIETDGSNPDDTDSPDKEDNVKEKTGKKVGKVKKPRKKRRIVLTVILTILVLLVLAAIISWAIINANGKSTLYDKAESTGPVLESVQTGENTETEANTEAEDDVTWQKGWVRYNGEIYQYNEDILTFLVMGIDKITKVKVVESGVNGGQADLLLLAVFNPHTKTTSLITINRNTMTEIDVYNDNGEFLGTGLGQICLQHGYGDGAELSCERTEKAVSNLFYNLPIHGYLSINMGAIKSINSAVGGVTMTLDEEFEASFDGVSVSLPKGEHTFTDDETNVFIRYRDKSEFDSATTRLNRQKKYIAAFLSKLKEETAKDVTVPLKVYNELSPYIVTDITTSEMTYMVSNTYNYTFDFDNIYSLQGTTVIGKTEHEEFNYDPDQLYDMIIEIFYEKVE